MAGNSRIVRVQRWGRSGDFLEKVMKVINLERGVGMSRSGGHTGQSITILSPLYRCRHGGLENVNCLCRVTKVSAAWLLFQQRES